MLTLLLPCSAYAMDTYARNIGIKPANHSRNFLPFYVLPQEMQNRLYLDRMQDALQNESYHYIHELRTIMPPSCRRHVDSKILNRTQTASLTALESPELISKIYSLFIGDPHDNPEAHHKLIHDGSFKNNLACIRRLYDRTNEDPNLTGKLFSAGLNKKQKQLIKKIINADISEEIKLSFFECFTARSLPDKIKRANKIHNKTFIPSRPLNRLIATWLPTAAPFTLGWGLASLAMPRIIRIIRDELKGYNHIINCIFALVQLYLHGIIYDCCDDHQTITTNEVIRQNCYRMPSMLMLIPSIITASAIADKSTSDFRLWAPLYLALTSSGVAAPFLTSAPDLCRNNIAPAIYNLFPAPQKGLDGI